MPIFFFFNDTATTEIYTLSLHDALPICDDWRVQRLPFAEARSAAASGSEAAVLGPSAEDRKSTRLNSSHSQISYAVFCLKKKTGSSQLLTVRDRLEGDLHAGALVQPGRT